MKRRSALCYFSAYAAGHATSDFVLLSSARKSGRRQRRALSENIFDSTRWLVSAIVTGLRAQRADEGVGDVLERIAEQDMSPQSCRSPAPRRLPACRHLPTVLGDLAMAESSLAAAIAAAEDTLAWCQNPNYSDKAMGQAGYMDNYAYAEIIGPSGVFAGHDFLLGLMILGPRLHYRDHLHSAPELYWMLTGPSEWRSGIGDFARRAAGETIWHAPLVPHATRTGDSPLLAMWAWTRDVGEPARLVAA